MPYCLPAVELHAWQWPITLCVAMAGCQRCRPVEDPPPPGLFISQEALKRFSVLAALMRSQVSTRSALVLPKSHCGSRSSNNSSSTSSRPQGLAPVTGS